MLGVAACSVFRIQRFNDRWQPGQWLAAIGAMELAEQAYHSMRPWYAHSSYPPSTRHFLGTILIGLVIACLATIAAVRSSGYVWRTMFAGLAFLRIVAAISTGIYWRATAMRWDWSSIEFLAGVFHPVSEWLYQIVNLSIVLAIVFDVWKRRRFCWAHWVGLLAWISNAIAPDLLDAISGSEIGFIFSAC